MKKLSIHFLIAFFVGIPFEIYAQKEANSDTIKRSQTSLYMELGGSGYVASIGINLNLIEKKKWKFYNLFLLSTHALIPYLDRNLGLNYGIGGRYGKKVFIGIQSNIVGYYSFFIEGGQPDRDTKKIYGTFSHQLILGFSIKNRIELNLSPTGLYPFYRKRYYPFLGFGVNIFFNKKTKNEKH